MSCTESFIHVGKYLEDSEAQKSVKATLIQVGLQTHLQSTLGGSLSKVDSSQAVVRIAVCLSWTCWLPRQSLGAMIPLYGPAAVGWFHHLIIKKYKLVPKYCTHLEVARKLRCLRGSLRRVPLGTRSRPRTPHWGCRNLCHFFYAIEVRLDARYRQKRQLKRLAKTTSDTCWHRCTRPRGGEVLPCLARNAYHQQKKTDSN